MTIWVCYLLQVKGPQIAVGPPAFKLSYTEAKFFY